MNVYAVNVYAVNACAENTYAVNACAENTYAVNACAANIYAANVYPRSSSGQAIDEKICKCYAIMKVTFFICFYRRIVIRL